MKKCLITSVPNVLFFNFHLCSWYYHLIDIICSKLRIYILRKILTRGSLGEAEWGHFHYTFSFRLKIEKCMKQLLWGKRNFLLFNKHYLSKTYNGNRLADVEYMVWKF